MSEESRDEQRRTILHINRVRAWLDLCTRELERRGRYHDRSKLSGDELALLAQAGPPKNHYTNIDAYIRNLEDRLGAFRQLHYAANPHHPEHYAVGIRGMNLFDLLEMTCDWLARNDEHDTEDLLEMLEINKHRFEIPDIAHGWIVNTVKFLKGESMQPHATLSSTELEDK